MLLRRSQYRFADDTDSSARFARSFVIGKIFNSRWVLERTKRDHNFEKCSQIEFDLCIWTYLGRRGTDVICVSAEMRFCLNHYLVKNVSFLRSLPARGVWIEIDVWTALDPCHWKSLPARGVWIEIASLLSMSSVATVTPRKGSVD